MEHEKKCEFCNKYFETRLDLIKHMHGVEASNLEKRYTCDICDVFKAFYMSEIRKHRNLCKNLLNVLKVEKQKMDNLSALIDHMFMNGVVQLKDV